MSPTDGRNEFQIMNLKHIGIVSGRTIGELNGNLELKLAFFLRIVDELFSGFRAKFQKRVTCVAFSIKFAKTN